MNPAMIFSIVEEVLGITRQTMINSSKDVVMDAKYVAILMMHEEGLSLSRMSEEFETDRSAIHKSLKAANIYLGNNRWVKSKYLSCIANMARREEMNDEEN